MARGVFVSLTVQCGPWRLLLSTAKHTALANTPAKGANFSYRSRRLMEAGESLTSAAKSTFTFSTKTRKSYKLHGPA